MLIKDYVDSYTQLDENQRFDFFKNTVVNQYMPFNEKVDLCDKIVKSTSYVINKDTKKPQLHVNSTAKYLMYTMSVLDYYTELEIDFANILDQYDSLDKNDLITEIYAVIPKKELNELDMVMEMCTSDLVQNEYETKSFIANQVGEFANEVSTTLLPVITSLTETIKDIDEVKMAKMVKSLESSKIFKLLKR